MDKVYIEPCEIYDVEKIEAILRPIVEKIQMETPIFKAGNRLFLKVNLLTDKSPDQFTTTHPVFTQAIIHILRDYGCSMILGDSCAGPFNKGVLKHLYKATGYLDLCEKENVELNYNTSSTIINGIPQVKIMHEVDGVVDICKLKAHSMATFTGAVKNCFGSVPGTNKALQHALHPTKKSFAVHIVDVCEVLNPMIAFMDGIEGMCGNGPSNGKLFKSELVAVSTNPYALDKTITDLLKISPALLSIDAEAKKRGHYDEIELISSLKKEDLYKEGFELPDSLKGKEYPYPSFDAERCIGCGRCAASCPQKTIQLIEHKAKLNQDKCIRCYCCQEVCPVNAIDLV